ncbi:MAG: AI-2E family transporter [Gammaproteobacteria bacterium]
MSDPDTEKPEGSDGEESEAAEAASAFKIRSGVLVGILVLMILYTAYFARAILIPMALAFLFSLILIPAVAWLARWRIPRPVGAVIVLALLLSGFGAGVYGLSTPALHWINEAPHAVRKVERMVHSPYGPLKKIRKTEKKVNHPRDQNQGPENTAAPVKVVQPQKSMMDQVMAQTPDILIGIGIAIVLLFFLLAASDSFLRSLAHAIPRWPDKRRAVEIARNIQHHIARYLFTITLINMCVGLVDGIALGLLGIPNPVLWGAMIAIFNYVPYLGALTSIVIVGLIAVVTFNQIGLILLAPGIVLVVAILEGQFITPHIVGRRLNLSPVAVFVTLVVWGWLWGVVGAIIAVPLLASFKLMCEEIEPLNPIAEFLTSYYGHKE